MVKECKIAAETIISSTIGRLLRKGFVKGVDACLLKMVGFFSHIFLSVSVALLSILFPLTFCFPWF